MFDILLILVILAFISVIYAFCEGKSLKVKRLFINDAPPSMNGKTIVAFSDVHIGSFVSDKQFKRCINKINNQQPDFILFIGDLADKNRDQFGNSYEKICSLLSSMKAKEGKFAVYGNNDYIDGKLKKVSNHAISESDFKLLANDGVLLKSDVCLLGLDESKYNNSDIKKALNGFESVPYKILLVHQPDFVDTACDNDVDIQISGHSHGGQIFIPFLYKFMLPDGAKKYNRGNHKVKNTMLYISNGVGLHTLPFRFLTPPDILVFKFRTV